MAAWLGWRCWLIAHALRLVMRSLVRLVTLGLILVGALLPLQPALAMGLAQAAPAVAAPAQLTQLRTEHTDDGVFITAAVSFELPAVVEDALLKGIPLFFLIEADVYRERWYWTDRRVAGASRTVRLAFQALTRRWRVNIGTGTGASGLRSTFNQNYDRLDEALAAVQRVARWKVAEAGELKAGADHRLAFNFRLDLSQLPRPFQIGMVGQRDWTIAVEAEQQIGREPKSVVEPPRDPPLTQRAE
jgi:hypothetical protein